MLLDAFRFLLSGAASITTSNSAPLGGAAVAVAARFFGFGAFLVGGATEGAGAAEVDATGPSSGGEEDGAEERRREETRAFLRGGAEGFLTAASVGDDSQRRRRREKRDRAGRTFGLDRRGR